MVCNFSLLCLEPDTCRNDVVTLFLYLPQMMLETDPILNQIFGTGRKLKHVTSNERQLDLMKKCDPLANELRTHSFYGINLVSIF